LSLDAASFGGMRQRIGLRMKEQGTIPEGGVVLFLLELIAGQTAEKGFAC
jgi:hypothetical protein